MKRAGLSPALVQRITTRLTVSRVFLSTYFCRRASHPADRPAAYFGSIDHEFFSVVVIVCAARWVLVVLGPSLRMLVLLLFGITALIVHVDSSSWGKSTFLHAHLHNVATKARFNDSNVNSTSCSGTNCPGRCCECETLRTSQCLVGQSPSLFSHWSPAFSVFLDLQALPRALRRSFFSLSSFSSSSARFQDGVEPRRRYKIARRA